MNDTDRDLLVGIGELSMREHAAWKARNEARKVLRAFFKNYTDETGERFDRGDCVDGGMHEDVAAFDAVSKPAKEAQRKLTTARAATRRAIVRAAASMADPIQSQGKT